MAGIYLYCIAPSGCRPDDSLVGLAGRPVEPLEVGPFCVWASTLETMPEATPDEVRAHHRVLDAALATEITPLPLRFGHWLAGADAARARVLERRAGYEATLRVLVGTVEYGIRVHDPTLPAMPVIVGEAELADGPRGRVYLNALARRAAVSRSVRQRGESVAAALREAVGTAARRERVEAVGGPGGLVAVAHLVGREDVDAYLAAVDRVRERHPVLRVEVTGPVPPYSFVS